MLITKTETNPKKFRTLGVLFRHVKRQIPRIQLEISLFSNDEKKGVVKEGKFLGFTSKPVLLSPLLKAHEEGTSPPSCSKKRGIINPSFLLHGLVF